MGKSVTPDITLKWRHRVIHYDSEADALLGSSS